MRTIAERHASQHFKLKQGAAMEPEITCGDLRKWFEKMPDDMPVRIIYGGKELLIDEAIPGSGVYKLYAKEEE